MLTYCRVLVASLEESAGVYSSFTSLARRDELAILVPQHYRTILGESGSVGGLALLKFTTLILENQEPVAILPALNTRMITRKEI